MTVIMLRWRRRCLVRGVRLLLPSHLVIWSVPRRCYLSSGLRSDQMRSDQIAHLHRFIFCFDSTTVISTVIVILRATTSSRYRHQRPRSTHHHHHHHPHQDPHRDMPPLMHAAFLTLFRAHSNANPTELWPLNGLTALHADAEEVAVFAALFVAHVFHLPPFLVTHRTTTHHTVG